MSLLHSAKNMRYFGMPALRTAALGLVLVACTADRVTGPSAPTHAPVAPQLALSAASLPAVRLSEIHYDNASTDVNESIEISGPAGTDVTGWKILLYNGNGGGTYEPTRTLSGTIPAACGDRGVIVQAYPANGIQNGDPDAVALVDAAGSVVEFLSYGGTFAATNGAANGMTSVSMGAKESGTTPVGSSLQRRSDGSWAAPAPNSFGACNDDGAPPPVAGPVETVALSPLAPTVTTRGTRQLTATAKDASGVDATATTTFGWTTSDSAVATVSATGLVTGVAMGSATITATSANGKAASTTVTVNAPTAGAVTIPAVGTLIVGYTEPLFPVVRDANGATIPNAKLVYTTADASIATVDTLGYVTATGVGSVAIKATAASGASGTVTVTVMAPETTNAVYRNHLEFGAPAGADASNDIRLGKPQYALSYNAARGGPNWVSWDLNASQFGAAPRCNCFSSDVTLPSSVYHVVDFDYRGSGYDRGHMTQSESRTSTFTENAATFLLTNILPQGAENNQGPWSKFENYLNDLVRTGGKEVYVTAGGQYAANAPTLKGEGKVAIPDYTWKVAVIVPAGKGLADVHSSADLQVIAIRMPNLTTPGVPASSVGIRNVAWETYKTTVDSLEAVTGLDFLTALPDSIQNIVESNDRAPSAAIAQGETTGVEGTAMSFAGSGADPDGDALTYAWDFGDGATTVGASATHTFADNGTYTVKLISRDPAGATGVDSVKVTIVNVAPTASFASPATQAEGGSFALSLTNVVEPSSADRARLIYAFDCGDGAGFGAPSAIPSASCATSDDGTRTVHGRVSDKDNGQSEYSATVNVTNVAPTIGAVTTTSAPTARGAQVSASVSFSDEGTGDTHAATISWGDGTASEVNAGSAAEASATHAYGAAGFYTVTVTVRDDDGGSAQAQSPTTVTVFDQAAGRLSGAGRIDRGRDGVGFGFDAGYGRSGKLEGRFGIISRDFIVDGDSLEYLVVSGAQGSFRGKGKLRDGTAVGFLVSGRDGRVARERDDKVRIKVWSLARNAVLYDTEPGVAELAPPATVVSGGQVILRK